jgi:hypothetical protein
MPARLQSKLTYANVMATMAMFVALGGSSYAAIAITGKNVKNGSLTGKDIKRNSIGGKTIKESRLGTVPNAQRLNGVTASRLLVRCPEGTFPAGGTCIERDPRAPQPYGGAVEVCANADGDRTAGRRLPTHGELQAAFSRVDPAPGGELTGHIYPNANGVGRQVLIVTTKGGETAVVPDDGNLPRAFRCAIDPLN